MENTIYLLEITEIGSLIVKKVVSKEKPKLINLCAAFCTEQGLEYKVSTSPRGVLALNKDGFISEGRRNDKIEYCFICSTIEELV